MGLLMSAWEGSNSRPSGWNHPSDPPVISPYQSNHGIGRAGGIVAFVVRNRIHLGPGAALIMWTMPQWYGSTPSWKAGPSIALAGFGVYQLNRVFDVVEDAINDPDASAPTSAARTAVRNVAVGAILGSLLLSVVLNNSLATATLSMMLLLGVLYSVPVLRRRRGEPRRLKQMAVLKNVIPSVVWPGTTILYPAIASAGFRWLPLLFAITAVSCAVFTIEVAWDVRDASGDQVAGISTLATALGAHRALMVPLAMSCLQALVIAMLIAGGKLATLWLLLALFLVLLPTLAHHWREALASDRNRSHVLVLINTSALIPLALAGRWGA